MKLKGDLFHCGRCRTSYSNPLGHTCKVKTDSKGQKTAGAKAAKKPPHRYQTCRDEGCQHGACLAYRDGYDTGYAEGYADGTAASEGK